MRRFSTDGVLVDSISGAIGNGWGLTYDGSHLWASDPVDDMIYQIALGLQVETTDLPDGVEGIAYSETLSAFGGYPPYAWALWSGNLPEGLSLESSGVISGVPSSVQTFDFTVVVFDTLHNSTIRELSITIKESTGIEEPPDDRMPVDFVLLRNCPNPFNPTTQIEYILPWEADVKLEIFNIQGRKVATLVEGRRVAGYHSAHWTPRSSASGVFLCRLQAGRVVQTRRMALIR